jgi:hypothetical protein
MFNIKLAGVPECRKSGSRRWNVLVPVIVRYGRKKDEHLKGHLVLPFSTEEFAKSAAERIEEERWGRK